MRTYLAPTAEAVSAYAQAVLTAPTSLLPGLSGIESVAAMEYARTLPMSRNASVVDVWLALTIESRGQWVEAARTQYAAMVS